MCQENKLNEVYSKILSYLQKRDFSKVEQICLFELGQLSREDDRLYFYLGTAARFMNKNKAAIVAFEAALKLAPENIDYLQACASAYEAEKDFIKAHQLVKQALSSSPDDIKVMANHAVALERIGDTQAALEQYEVVLSIDEQNRTANMNYGSLLHKLDRKKEALAHNRIAHARLPTVFGTLYNLVDTLIANYCYEEALSYCDTGLAWQPRHAQLMVKKAMCLSGLEKPEEALVFLSKARIINPKVLDDILPSAKNLAKEVGIYLDGYILLFEARYNEQKSCYWQYRDRYIAILSLHLEKRTSAKFALTNRDIGHKILSLPIDAITRKKQLSLIANQISDFTWLFSQHPFQYNRSKRNRIRIGYLSPDFRLHATAVLSRQIYGLHDRSKFEIYCYSLKDTKPDDLYLQEIRAGSDQFHDVSKMPSVEIAKLIHAESIDILIDLAGYTGFSRTEVMAMRPAPVQFQYLGFGATTMGADFIDYVLIDKQLCLNNKEDEFTEQAIRLPHTIYPYDNEIDHSETTYKRADFDLPEDAFVFCCLNNTYKIEPVIFDRWMNILKAVPKSVLWLLGKGLDVQDNLEREALARGVDKSRLVFTGLVPLEQHLPRYQLADLFLDTYWVNAHTTAAEALWQGLPLITIMGEVSSARGAASVLTALEMPELIVQSHDEYEQLAIYYATHPEEYAAMREKLKAKRYTAPMYNTKLTVKHIEKAYQMAWERYQAGLPPAAFDVPENTDPELRKSIH